MARDLRLAVRSLVHRPALALATLATLGLGIGAATALFSVVWTYVLGPARYPASDRLMAIVERGADGNTMGVDLPTAREWSAAPVVAAAGVLERDDAWIGRDAPLKAPVAFASSGVLASLEVRPARGRLLARADDERGAPPVVVLSDGGWRRLTDADPRVVGRMLVLDGRTHVIVGVLPASFRFGSRVDAWASLSSWLQTVPPDVVDGRSEKSLMMIARLRPRVSERQAAAQLSTISAQVARTASDGAGIAASVRPLVGYLAADERPALLTLLAAVATLLVVACFDLGVLWLVRAYARQREIAVRRALGASSPRILTLLAAESVTICALGGGLGVAIAALGVRVLDQLLPFDATTAGTLGVEPAAIAMALALALLVGALFAGLPLLASRRSPAAFRAGRGSRGTRESSRASAPLVAGQVAGATALLQVGALLVASLLRLLAVDPGFEPRQAIVAPFTLSSADARDAGTTMASWNRALAAVGGTVGVQAVGATTHPPLGPMAQMNVEIEGVRAGAAGPPLVAHSSVAGEVFAALGLRIVAGRTFSAVDQRERAQPTVIVNQTLARRYWPGQQAVGKHLRWAIPGLPEFPWRTVVGVVADSHDYGVGERVEPAAFYPYEQLPAAYLPSICKTMTIVARYRGAPGNSMTSVRRALAEALPSAFLGQVETLSTTLSESLSRPRLFGRLTAAFALVALALVALGIHGVLAMSVAQRRQELAIRLAVGAQPRQLRALVISRGLRLAGAGVAIGLPTGIVAAHAVSALLYGVSAADPRWSLGVVATVLVVSATGSVVPAIRAMGLEPSRALGRE